MSSNTSAEAFAPASMGNLGVGFDILGLAFEEPGDCVVVERRETPGAAMTAIEGDGGLLPLDPARNTAAVAANHLLQRISERTGERQGIGITLKKGLPLASGLGSSAASAVAAVVATNALFGSPFTREELLSSCLEGEALVSGYHADNVGPCLLGGITLITGTALSDIRQLPVPAHLHLALVTPDVAVPTAEARAALPPMVALSAMVQQTGGVARLVDALYRGDVEAMAAAMEADGIIEPARKRLMPLLDEVRAAAKRTGALGMVISGAGPTLCAVCNDPHIAAAVAAAMQAIYDEADIGAVSRHTRVNEAGARVVQSVW